jgi:hypothetical protein
LGGFRLQSNTCSHSWGSAAAGSRNSLAGDARSTRWKPSAPLATPEPSRNGGPIALGTLCRNQLTAGGIGDGRQEPAHVSIVADLNGLAGISPALATTVRTEAAHVGRLSRATLERLTCDCKISRIITDGPSIVLDLGRSTRTVSKALWNALVVRDRHCRTPGCDRPPGWCEAHHIVHWEHGGPTNLDNLMLLCRRHHREHHAHAPPRE